MTATATATAEELPVLLLDRLKENVKKTPKKVAFSFLSSGVDGGRVAKTLTYDELATETTALAVRLLEAGLKRGDRYVSSCIFDSFADSLKIYTICFYLLVPSSLFSLQCTACVSPFAGLHCCLPGLSQGWCSRSTRVPTKSCTARYVAYV